jgi:choline dehydrogenase-like flavoprotein
MFIDLSMQSIPKKILADICIVGSGPAGISLALQLEKQGKSVCLLEAGGENPVYFEKQDPYDGENVGRPYDMLTTRLRYFGGTSNHWGVVVPAFGPYRFQTERLYTFERLAYFV